MNGASISTGRGSRVMPQVWASLAFTRPDNRQPPGEGASVISATKESSEARSRAFAIRLRAAASGSSVRVTPAPT